jgi:DEAD/DEAH box helicase domain-containing protein
LVLRPRTIPPGLNLDPRFISVKAAYYSAAFLLRAVIANEEEIDSDEIEVCNIRRTLCADSSNQTDFLGEIYLGDQLANGSGFVNRIFETWETIIKGVLKPSIDSFCGTLISKDHDCDSACYDCLKEYSNMAYHGFLDWKLGLAYLRILGDGSYRCGLDGNFNFPEVSRWLVDANRMAESFAREFDRKKMNFGMLPGIELNSTKRVILVHPLWRTDVHKQGILADATAAAGGKALYLDTFNLSRRPGSSYLSLGA